MSVVESHKQREAILMPWSFIWPMVVCTISLNRELGPMLSVSKREMFSVCIVMMRIYEWNLVPRTDSRILSEMSILQFLASSSS